MAESRGGAWVLVGLVALVLGVLLGTFVLRHTVEAEEGHALQETDLLAFAVSHILVRVGGQEAGPDGPAQAPADGRTEGRAMLRARQTYDALREGKSFEEVARARSDDDSAADGGFLAFIDVGQDSAFSGAVRALVPGSVSLPLRTQPGWQIIKRHTFDEARALEQRYAVPTHGFFFQWGEAMPGQPVRSKEQARALAEDVKERLVSGTLTMEEAARQYVPHEHRATDAFIGFTRDRPTTHAVWEAMRGAKPGEFVGPVQLERNTFGVFRRGRYLRSLARHILVQHIGSRDRNLRVTRMPEEARGIAERALKEVLADRSAWDSAVERYSDDEQSRPNGGIMGVLDPGRIPDGFQSFIYDQEPGTIWPEVVETPLGFHVVWKVN